MLKDVNMKFYEFHDTKLCDIVQNAYHAVAIDENRQEYDVCLWKPETAAAQKLEQRWFLGAHCDIGGGYKSRLLSDMALRWMQDKASALGLGLDAVTVGAQNYLGEFTDSYARFPRRRLCKKKSPPLSRPAGREVRQRNHRRVGGAAA